MGARERKVVYLTPKQHVVVSESLAPELIMLLELERGLNEIISFLMLDTSISGYSS